MQSAETLENLQKFLKLLDPSKSRADMLTGVAQQLVEMFDVDHSGVMFFSATDTEGEVVAEYPPQGVVGLRASLLNYPLVDELKVERKPIAVVDAQEDPFMGSMRDTFRALGIKSIAIIPLLVKDKLIGGLGLDVTRGKRVFTQAELELGGIIGTQIAVAIDYLEALEAAESSRRQAQTLRQINRVLSESLDLAEVLPLILKQSEKVIPIDGSSIYLLVKGRIQVEAWRGAKGSDHLSPAKVMSEVNRLLCDDIPRGTFVAMSYALLAPHQSTVYLSSGGQLAPFLVPARGQPIQLVETPTPRWPMGIMPDSCYQETTVNLEPNDLLVFYTDGLVERKNEGNELFGFERVGALLDEVRGQPPEQTLQCLLAAADNFAQGLSAHDDVTLVVVQRVNAINNRKEMKNASKINY